MNWIRQNLVLILFSALIALQAVSSLMQVVTLSHLESIKLGVWSSSRIVGENVAHELRSNVLKVSICDVAGRNCANTSVAKVTTLPNIRTSPSDPAVRTVATYGLVIASPD